MQSRKNYVDIMLILMKMSRVYQVQITQFKERCSTLYFGNTSTALSERRWRPATWRSANMCLLVVADCSGIVTSGVCRHPGCSTGYESKQWVLNSEFRIREGTDVNVSLAVSCQFILMIFRTCSLKFSCLAWIGTI